MITYPNIIHCLRTLFNAEDGLSEDAAQGLYMRSIESSGRKAALVQELKAALVDQSFSWKSALFNDEYEVFDAASEEEARDYARNLLWEPIQRV
jgi:hypothetical protein